VEVAATEADPWIAMGMMGERHLLWLKMAGLLWVALLVTAASSVADPIRGAYFYHSMPAGHLDRLAAHGFTTGLVKYTDASLTPALLADAGRKRSRADSLGLDLFITINFHNRNLMSSRSAPDRRFRDRRGVVHPELPCPADTAYWCGLFEEWILPMARATASPARIALDFELYNATLSHYPPGPCHCIPCRLEYAGYTGANRALAESWIDRLPLGDFEDLERAENDWLTTLFFDQLSALVHERSSLELAVLDLGRPGLPTRALLAAAARLNLPLIDFTELTYDRGSSVPREQLTVAYSNHPGPVATVGGFWLKKWSPQALEGEAVQLARRDAGYWIFTSASLAVPESALSGPYTLQGSQEDYWLALRRANLELATGD
jgi:hypothetical protein